MKHLLLIGLALTLLTGCAITGAKDVVKESRGLLSWFKSTPTVDNQTQSSNSSFKDTKSKFLGLIQWIMGISASVAICAFIALYFRVPVAGDVLTVSGILFGGSLCASLFFDVIIWVISVSCMLFLAYIVYMVYSKARSHNLIDQIITSFEVQKEDNWKEGGKEKVKKLDQPPWVHREIKKRKRRVKYDLLRAEGRI